MVIFLLIVVILVGVFFGISVANASGSPIFGVVAGIVGIIACFYIKLIGVIAMIVASAALMLKSR